MQKQLTEAELEKVGSMIDQAAREFLACQDLGTAVWSEQVLKLGDLLAGTFGQWAEDRLIEEIDPKGQWFGRMN